MWVVVSAGATPSESIETNVACEWADGASDSLRARPRSRKIYKLAALQSTRKAGGDTVQLASLLLLCWIAIGSHGCALQTLVLPPFQPLLQVQLWVSPSTTHLPCGISSPAVQGGLVGLALRR